MIDKLKIIFQHSMMISFGILLGISIQGIVFHHLYDSFSLSWYHPISIVLTGFLCACPSLLLGNDGNISKKNYILRIILHFILLFIIIMVGGFLVNWYDTVHGGVAIAIEFVFVYCFVWAANAWIGVFNQNSINKALDSIRDEE